MSLTDSGAVGLKRRENQRTLEIVVKILYVCLSVNNFGGFLMNHGLVNMYCL